MYYFLQPPLNSKKISLPFPLVAIQKKQVQLTASCILFLLPNSSCTRRRSFPPTYFRQLYPTQNHASPFLISHQAVHQIIIQTGSFTHFNSFQWSEVATILYSQRFVDLIMLRSWRQVNAQQSLQLSGRTNVSKLNEIN